MSLGGATGARELHDTFGARFLRSPAGDGDPGGCAVVDEKASESVLCRCVPDEAPRYRDRGGGAPDTVRFL